MKGDKAPNLGCHESIMIHHSPNVSILMDLTRKKEEKAYILHKVGNHENLAQKLTPKDNFLKERGSYENKKALN